MSSTTSQTKTQPRGFSPTLIWDEEFAERWERLMGRGAPEPEPRPAPVKRKPRRPSPTK